MGTRSRGGAEAGGRRKRDFRTQAVEDHRWSLALCLGIFVVRRDWRMGSIANQGRFNHQETKTPRAPWRGIGLVPRWLGVLTGLVGWGVGVTLQEERELSPSVNVLTDYRKYAIA